MSDTARTAPGSTGLPAPARTTSQSPGPKSRQLTPFEVFRGRKVMMCVHNGSLGYDEYIYPMHVALLSHFSATLRDKLTRDAKIARISTNFDCPKKHAKWVCEWMIAGGRPLGKIPLTCDLDGRLEELQDFMWLVLHWDIPGLIDPAAKGINDSGVCKKTGRRTQRSDQSESNTNRSLQID